jgi:hypothetical protein
MKKLTLPMALMLALLLTAGKCDPPPPEVIIPDTTKVTDAATREALQSYDADSGEMRFSRTTPVLQNLKPNDVLVSEPSLAAPYGYLRKVKAIRQEGGELVLETTQANLTEAIHQGSFAGEGEFTADDIAAEVVLVKGVRPEELAAQVGSSYRFKLNFNEVVLDLGQGGVQGQARLSGELAFNAGWSIGGDIGFCGITEPVCVRRFAVKVRFEEQLKPLHNANAPYCIAYVMRFVALL